jgi:2-oxo-4-hydroxy-4-carboxy--5-ureidoimidazoline (OHCU) decarboxylase
LKIAQTTKMADKISVADLVAKDPKEISESLGGIYEHSPWVADALIQDPDALVVLRALESEYIV